MATFINGFQKKKAWNLPKSSTNLSNFKTCFFLLLEMWRFSFFFGNFPNCSLHHVCFHGGLYNGFSSQKINKIKIKLAALHLCVCLSWFRETGGLHSVRRSRVLTSVLIRDTTTVQWVWCLIPLLVQRLLFSYQVKTLTLNPCNVSNKYQIHYNICIVGAPKLHLLSLCVSWSTWFRPLTWCCVRGKKVDTCHCLRASPHHKKIKDCI